MLLAALSQDPHGLEFVRTTVMLVLLIGSIYYDLRFRIIPNWLTAPGLALGLVMQASKGVGILFQTAWLVALLTYPFIIGFQKGWVGGGDVKLVAAVALLSGLDLAVPIFLAGTVMAGVFSMCCLVGALPKDQGKGLSEKVWVPYGALYALGALIFKGMLAWGLVPWASFCN